MQLELKSVSYTYSPNTSYSAKAVDDVSLQIEQGEFIGIMGKTGCGKSTLLQLMAGLLDADDGNVFLFDKDINGKGYDRRKLRESVGVLFQFPDYQLFETTVFRDVAFGLKQAGMKKSDIETNVKEALELVGFDYDKVKDKSPLGFSGGEKRRLAIAGVLAVKPEILLLDEPVAGLDPLGRKEFLTLLKKLNENGTSVVMVSHNADALAECASRIILMKNGKIAADGSAEDILSDYDMLHQSGICAGQVKSISKMLSDKGFAVSEKTVKYNQLIDEICRVCGRENK
ncbi:MAG: energy-coupling factor transporter ATPase [Clostridiales bacterium]|nr:energy-coupling factor transporter ATPase [Clostridiales bacterium]